MQWSFASAAESSITSSFESSVIPTPKTRSEEELEPCRMTLPCFIRPKQARGHEPLLGLTAIAGRTPTRVPAGGKRNQSLTRALSAAARPVARRPGRRSGPS
jgi:hypothetical protein